MSVTSSINLSSRYTFMFLTKWNDAKLLVNSTAKESTSQLLIGSAAADYTKSKIEETVTCMFLS